MSFARPAIKIAAMVSTSVAVVFSLLFVSVSAAPEASASSSYPTHLTLQSNLTQFKNQTASYYGLSGKAYRWDGNVPKGLSGYASLYVNDKFQRSDVLESGWFGFRISRTHLPDNQQVKVTVKVHPRNSDFSSRIVNRWITDVKTTEGQEVVQVAKAQVGDNYQYGADGPSSFDCSGLVQYAYRKATGEYLPHSSSAIKNEGRPVAKGDARPGDVVWTPGHVAIYAGGGKVVEAASSRTGVIYRYMWQSSPTFIRI